MQNGRAVRRPADEATPVGKALDAFLKASGLADSLSKRGIRDTWRETVGNEVCEHTRVAGLRKNILIIEVDSAPWLNELAGFYKATILKEVQRKLPGERIQDIQFRAGSF